MPRTRASAVGGGMRFVTGTYTGNGAAAQAIVGVGFQPRFVIIYAESTPLWDVGLKTDQDAVATKASRAGGWWYYWVDMIISLDVDGFTVGDGTGFANIFNIVGQVYTYIAFR